MATPPHPLPRTGGLVFVVIVWLLLSLVSGAGVVWVVTQGRAAGQVAPSPGSSPAAAADQPADPGPAPRPASDHTASAPAPAGPNDPYMQGWVLVIDNCFQSACSYDEIYDRAAGTWHPAGFEVIDSSRYPGLRPGVWAVVARDLTWSSRAAAQEACADYDLEAGGECYGRRPGHPHPDY